MQRIGPDGTRLTELASAAQVTKQTAGFLVDQLERGRYVSRVADPTDARARLVILAVRGRRAVAMAAREVAAVETEWTAHLGRRQVEHLRSALTRLREVTSAYR